MKDLITNYWNKARGKGPIQTYWEEQAPAEDDAKLCDLKYKCAEGHTQDHDWVFHRVFHSTHTYCGKLLNVKLNRFDCSIHWVVAADIL